MDFLEKLDFMMKKHSLNKNTLSKACNIPYTTIDNWYKRGYEGLKLATVRKIASFFDTTLDYWFLDGVTDENYGKSSGFEVSYDEMEHIEKYRSLDGHGKRVVDFILEEEYTRSSSSAVQHKDASAYEAERISKLLDDEEKEDASALSNF